jgi:hypothetical protein
LPPEIKRTFVAYCGPYTFDGTRLVTHADSASSPDLLTDQVRHIRFDGPRRMTAVPVSRLLGRSGGTGHRFQSWATSMLPHQPIPPT